MRATEDLDGPLLARDNGGPPMELRWQLTEQTPRFALLLAAMFLELLLAPLIVANFSFITLTTVGYGDMHPNNPGAGGLAVSEALVGQLYLAMTVARLVGIHISNRGK